MVLIGHIFTNVRGKIKQQLKYFFVVGLKEDYLGESGVAFLQSRSSQPAEDVERALSMGCGYAIARLLDGDDAEEELSGFIEKLRFQGTPNQKTRETHTTPRLEHGTLTYNIIGLALDRTRRSPETGRYLYKTNFVQRVSVTPSDDVKRALRAGSASVRVMVNYEPSEEDTVSYEENRRRLAELKKSEERVKEDLIQASLPDASPRYIIVGFGRDPKGEANVGRYLTPPISKPGKEVEEALRMKCHWITISLLVGRPELAQALVNYEEALGRRKEKGDPFKLFPIPQPQQKRGPSVGDGPTTCKILGQAQTVEGFREVRWRKDDSTSPAADVELALRAGATEVTVEVITWGIS